MILASVLAAALTSATPDLAAMRRTDCEIYFDADLVGLLPAASYLNLEQVLELVPTYAPDPQVVAKTGAGVIGQLDAGPNLRWMMECGNAGAHFTAKVMPGVYRVEVRRMSDDF